MLKSLVGIGALFGSLAGTGVFAGAPGSESLGAAIGLERTTSPVAGASKSTALATKQTLFVTRSGEFRADFPGTPSTTQPDRPAQTFTMVDRWTSGPITAVSYLPSSSGWQVTVELVRIIGGAQHKVVAVLAKNLSYDFITIKGVAVASIGHFAAGASSGASESSASGDVVVTSTALHEVLATGPTAQDAQRFLASFSAPGFAGVPAPIGETAVITGFSHVLLDNASSGPISVQLGKARADQIAAVIDSLPRGGSPRCLEDALAYRIVFRPSPKGLATFEADGYDCEAAVVVKIDGMLAAPRSDIACELIDAVREVLPGKARGTNTTAIGCHAAS